MKNLIVILGPTAVGKTDLSIGCAERYGSPIISCDSRQMYDGMLIGTAAPSQELLNRVKHYFIGNLKLTDYYSAAMFEEEFMTLSSSLFKEHDTLVMCGGSMMYIDAVCNGIDDIPTIEDEVRENLKKRLEQEGLERLCEELRLLDPEYYNIVDKKNTRRVIHGLEICYQTGKTYTSFRKRDKKERPFNIIKIALNREREELYCLINKRVDQMIEEGFIDEARALYGQRELNSLNTVGYKELFDHFDGIYSLEDAIERIKGNTRRYARKQLTWFKRDPEVKWFHPDNVDEIINYISQQIG